jgi:hypothetical protein
MWGVANVTPHIFFLSKIPGGTILHEARKIYMAYNETPI